MDTHAHSIKASIRSAARYLADCGVEDARADAEILLAHVLGVPRTKLISGDKAPLPEKMRQQFNRFIARRGEKREPLAYITGSAGFYGLELAVSGAVLIPRPATEKLVEIALKRLPPRGSFADVGTGSGAIAIAILANAPGAEGIATDVDERALVVARRNAKALGVARRLDVRLGDLFEPLGHGRYDAVLSNPPYVAEDELARLAPELSREPRGALVAGPEGLEVIRRIIPETRGHLADGGRLLLEIGAGQAKRCRELAFHAGFRGVQFHEDLEGIDRVLEAW